MTGGGEGERSECCSSRSPEGESAAGIQRAHSSSRRVRPSCTSVVLRMVGRSSVERISWVSVRTWRPASSWKERSAVDGWVGGWWPYPHCGFHRPYRHRLQTGRDEIQPYRNRPWRGFLCRVSSTATRLPTITGGWEEGLGDAPPTLSYCGSPV